MRLLFLILVGLVVVLSVSAPGWCQSTSEAMGLTVVKPRRLVLWMDFEERTDQGRLVGTGLPMPPNWYAIGRAPDTNDAMFLEREVHAQAVGRAGFPLFNAVGYDETAKAEGRFSLRLHTERANVGAFLEVGAVPIMPGSDYLVSATVRTQNLQRSRFQLRVFFVDAQGRPLVESESTTIVRGNHDFHLITARLHGEHDRAAWLGLEVTLLQNDDSPADLLGEQKVHRQDVDATAWIDNVAIWQLPHVEVATTSDVGVIREPDNPRLTMKVRDLTGQQLLAVTRVYDLNRNLLEQQVQPVGHGAATMWDWRPKLDRYGWYLVDFQVIDQAVDPVRPVARTATAFVYLPAIRITDDRDMRRFTWAPHAEGLAMDMTLRLYEQLGLKSLNAPLFTSEMKVNDVAKRLTQLDPLVRSAAARQSKLSFTLDPIPEALRLATGSDRSSPLSVMTADVQTWQPWLQPVFRRFGQRVRTWRLVPANFAAYPDAERQSEIAEKAWRNLSRLTPEPALVVPWADVRTLEKLPGVNVQLPWPAGISPNHLEAYLESWGLSPRRISLAMEVPGADEMSQDRRIDDLVRRMVEAWRLGVGELVLSKDWTWSASRERHDSVNRIIPGPAVTAYAQVSRQLAGRRVIGELPLPEGLRGLILSDVIPHADRESERSFSAGGSGGMLVMWNQKRAATDAQVAMYLGRSPVSVDVWGNRQAVEQRQGIHRFTLTSTPIFIEGIDARLAMFRSGFVLDEPVIEAAQVRHSRKITLTNPWPVTISGHMTISGPSDWDMFPQRQHFAIASGQTMTYDIALSFPVSVVSGPIPLEAKFEFTADQAYEVTMRTPMEVRMRQLDFRANLVVNDGDVTVVCTVTNAGHESQSFHMFTSLHGHRRQERPISGLEPGQTVVRRFTFENGESRLENHAVWAGIRETNGPALLNQRLSVGQ